MPRSVPAEIVHHERFSEIRFMSRPTTPIKLTPSQDTLIKSIVRCREVAHSLVQRARIILKISQGNTNNAVAKEEGLCAETVGTWRRRWVHGSEDLEKLEGKLPQLREKVVALLEDKPRSGCPETFTAEQICLIVALACETPPECISHWTRADLVREVVKRGIAEKISASSIGRILAEGDLKPHRSRYWLNHVVADEVVFREDVREVCKVYHQAQELAEQGIHVISTDEKTGIQALERTQKTRPMEPGKPEAQEFEYERHGTQTLIANFDVVTGKVIVPTIGQTRTEEDMVAHIWSTVATDPKGDWIFIMDQLNTHKSAGLVELVADLCGVKEGLGEKGKSGILKDMDSRAQFLSDEQHRVRFIYTPKHCSWLNQVEIWFGILSRRLLKRASFASTEVLKARIFQFIDFFNENLAKPFRWTYIGKPLLA